MLIISLSYSLLVISTRGGSEDLSLLSVKEFMQDLKSARLAGVLSLKCFDEPCNKCAIYEDGKEIKKLDLLKHAPKIYDFDKNGHFDEIKQKKDYCFRLDLYKNGAFTRSFAEYDGEYYIFDAFAPTQKFTDLEAALKAYNPKDILPVEKEDFYAF